MNHESEKQAADTVQAPLGAEALARRRMLLKSLGKGSAVAAAASPLTSFAAPLLVPTTEGTQCTFSGFQSVVASKGPIAPLPCGGFRASHFVDAGQAVPKAVGWPQFTFPMRSGATSPSNLKFSDLFGSSAPATPVLEILATNSPPDLALFVAAYFNALLVMQSGAAPSGRTGLPYSTLDVVAQYANGAYHASVPQFYRQVLVAN